MPELAHADIDGDAQRCGRRPLRPDGQLLASRGQRPVAQRQDQATFLGQRNEIGRHDQPAPGMLPAQQGLDAGHAALAVHLGLVMQHELLLAHAGVQLGADRGAGIEGGLHFGVKKAHGIAPRGLGLVHRLVGLLEHLAHAVVRAIERCHADARRGVVLVPVQVKRFAQRCQHLVGQRAGSGGGRRCILAQVFEQHHEFIAAQPRHRVGELDAASQALGDLLQQQVALVVAQRVVEHLELVHVDEHQGAVATHRHTERHHLFEPVEQHQPVGQAGQRVVERQLVNGVSRDLALRDVPAHGHPVAQLVGRGGDLHNFQFKPEAAAVFAVDQQFAARLALARQRPGQAFEFVLHRPGAQ